jgi:hypothetical protein
MNLIRLKTEAEVTYAIRRQTLDNQIRIADAAHSLLGKVVEGTAGDLVLGALYANLTKKTLRTVRVPRAALAVQGAARSSVAMSIAAIQSDFEWACRDLLTDSLEFWESQFTPALGVVRPPPDRISPLAKRGWSGAISESLRARAAGEGFVEACYSILGFAPAQADLASIPLFDFFRRCRNRIIHQDGTAGRELAEFAKSREVGRSLAGLSPAVRRMVATLPILNADDPIPLTPLHSILFLVVTFNLYKALVARVRARLNEDGCLRMSAYYAYGPARHTFRLPQYRAVIYPAVVFLRFRYGVTEINKEQLVQRFKALGLWEAMTRRFKELFLILA